MEERKDILKRVYLVYICCCFLALAILSRVFVIQFSQGDYWKAEAKKFMNKEQYIEAVRGNIFATDGSLLATSLPYYQIGIDPLANKNIDDSQFEDSAKGLADGLARILDIHAASEYLKTLLSARARGLRYQQLARNVTYNQLQSIKKLPLFRAGQFKGGFVYEQTNHRARPFSMLAGRTIGYISDSGKVKVGLEGAFDSILTGVRGKK